MKADRLYHRVPTPMVGEVLYPLNHLGSISEEAAAEARKKYASREHLMRVRLPILDCLWNDVLHLSPIHPAKIKAALLAAGCYRAEDLNPLYFFAIDPRGLPAGWTIYFKHSKEAGRNYDFLESDFTVFDPENYRELAEVPERQAVYFREMKEIGKRPLLWAKTAHVFHAGEIPTAGLETVCW